MIRTFRHLGLLTLFTLAAGVAEAQDRPRPRNSFGVRLGGGIDPDQFVVGAQGVFGRAVKIARFAPSIDAGFGGDSTSWAFNADLHLSLFAPPKTSTALYAAVGPTLAVWSWSDTTDTEVGVTITAGLKMPMGRSNAYNLEARFGLGDVPTVRVLFGLLIGGGERREPETIRIRPAGR